MKFTILFGENEIREVETDDVERNDIGQSEWKPVLPGYRLMEVNTKEGVAFLAVPG